MSKHAQPRPWFARLTRILAVTCALGTTHASEVRAQDTKKTPLEALLPYDTEGNRTLQAIADLRVAMEAEPNARHKRELGFVRAMALVDLWLIGQQSQNVRLLDGVAEAAGAPRSEVPAALRTAINQASEPVVGDIVRDARMALLLTDPHRANNAELTRGPMGLRSEAVFVRSVARALSAEKAIESLAGLGHDPCPAQTSCTGVYAPFDATGRRAIEAVEHALAAAERLKVALDHDPFLQALRAQFEQDRTALKGADFGPSARLSPSSGRAHETQLGSTTAPDLVMFVDAGHAELAFVPRVRVSEAGSLALYSRGEPMLPATQSVSLPATFPAFVKIVPELVTALLPLVAQVPDATLSIAAAPETPAHLWARALLSAQSARFLHIAMLGVDTEGVMRSLEVEVVSSLRAAEVGPRDINVVVRLGGFTVKRAGPAVTIPRVKKDDGLFVFDFDGLLQNAQPKGARSAKLTFMSDVAAETLAETAFSLAPPQSALTVILP